MKSAFKVEGKWPPPLRSSVTEAYTSACCVVRDAKPTLGTVNSSQLAAKFSNCVPCSLQLFTLVLYCTVGTTVEPAGRPVSSLLTGRGRKNKTSLAVVRGSPFQSVSVQGCFAKGKNCLAVYNEDNNYLMMTS
ncbi:hypothetical protein J6590_036411 [Homalodisca vitripennis]|nr:hypothetical protein J6590_036411 [Homalodisca vitripennis]